MPGISANQNRDSGGTLDIMILSINVNNPEYSGLNRTYPTLAGSKLSVIVNSQYIVIINIILL
jgi:hypothetical protein